MKIKSFLYITISAIILMASPVFARSHDILLMSNATINVGEAIELGISDIDKVPVWTSYNENIAKVNACGVVTGVKAGKTTIAVRAGEIVETCTVAVMDAQIKLNKSRAVIYYGGSSANSIQLKASVKGTSKTVSWESSNAAVAEVNNTGEVKSISAGTAVITASANGKSASCIVTVKESSLELNMSNITLTTKGTGSSVKLLPVVVGSNKSIKWTTSNKNIATVSGGKITGKKAGTAYITATANGISKTVDVTVKSGTGVSKNAFIDIKEGTVYLKTKGSDKTFNLTTLVIGSNTLIKWQSSDMAVVSVRGGKITAKKEGVATVTATANNVSDTVKVVVENSMPSISLNQDQYTLYTKAGNTVTLKAYIIGSDKAAAWSSSNEKAAIVDKGKVTAKGEGIAIITATANGVSDTCTVTVKDAGLMLSDSYISMSAGDEHTILCDVTGINQAVKWTTTDSKVATVKNGKITAKKDGEADIKATANGITEICHIIVRSEKCAEHEYDSGYIIKAPTCNSTGVIKYTCSKCKHSCNQIISPTAEHDYEEKTIPATCTAKGLKTLRCSLCGDIKKEYLPLVNHNYLDEVIQPTCINDGYTLCICSECGDKKIGDTVPALGHSFDEWVTVTEPDEKKEGLKKRICTVCSYNEEEIIPALYATDDEIEKAIAYGFVPDNWKNNWNRQLKSEEFFEGLTRVVSAYGDDAAGDWQQYLKDAKNGVSMRTTEGRIAVYVAACAMGLGEATNGKWIYVSRETYDDGWGFERGPIRTIFSFQSDPAPFCNLYTLGDKRVPDDEYWTYEEVSRLWCYGQFSRVSGKNIFDFQRESGITKDVPLTADIAARALVRLYESTFTPECSLDESSDELHRIISAADNRREAIIGNTDEIVKSDKFIQGKTYTGTAYYVANDGNDSNSGTSESSPWATLEKVSQTDLNPGDAVFFKRGDVFYGGFYAQEMVTYSAYGEGEKPTFLGAERDGSKSSSWSLYSAKGDVKIWKYKDELGDTAGIFFNNNSMFAQKIMPCWDGYNYIHQNGSVFAPENGLTENLMFFNAIDISGLGINARIEDSGRMGPLYLRCDEGNPAEVFDDVQVATYFLGFTPRGDGSSYCTADNLCFYYYGLAMSCSGYQGSSHTLIQNCEIGYSGGFLQQYQNSENTGVAYPWTSGGALHIAGSNQTATNNYIHDCASKVFILANHYKEGTDLLYHDDIMRGNLIEHCSTALHAVDYIGEDTGDAEQHGGFENIVLEDNMIMYAGYGWFEKKEYAVDYYFERFTESSIEFGGMGWQNIGNNGINIRNNTFCVAKHALIHCYMPDSVFPDFEGNTYVQAENGWLAEIRGYMLSITEGAYAWNKEYLHDENGSFYVL